MKKLIFILMLLPLFGLSQTATKTYTFTGSAEGWSPTIVTGTPTLAYSSNTLQYSGEIGRNKSGEGYFSISGTFASIFGVDAGVTVTGYSNAAFDGECTNYTSVDYFYEGEIAVGTYGSLRINDGTDRILIDDQSDYGGTGTHTPDLDPNIGGLSLAATTSITLYIYWTSDNANNASAQAVGTVDNISVTIEYTTPSGYPNSYCGMSDFVTFCGMTVDDASTIDGM